MSMVIPYFLHLSQMVCYCIILDYILYYTYIISTKCINKNVMAFYNFLCHLYPAVVLLSLSGSASDFSVRVQRVSRSPLFDLPCALQTKSVCVHVHKNASYSPYLTRMTFVILTCTDALWHCAISTC